MVGKHKRDDESDGGDDEVEYVEGRIGAGARVGHVTNKLVRADMYKKATKEAKKERKMARKQRQKEYDRAVESGIDPPPKKIPRTMESVREIDDSMLPAEGDEEVDLEEDQDEFAEHFKKTRPPKVLITTSYKPKKEVKNFILDMLRVFPVAVYYERRQYALKKIVEYAKNENFTDIVVFNQDKRKVNAMLVIHLPDGPTALFKIRNLKLSKEIKRCGAPTTHKPEIVLNNFDTSLGRRIGRMFASLFDQNPQFRGRQVATFHNQRDFIFFRHHRYVFEEKEKTDRMGRVVRKLRARLQELGPRFTLRLLSMQKGTFDSKFGEFEWVKKRDMKKIKKRFYL